MIDLKYIQNNFEEASIKLSKKGVSQDVLNELNDLFQLLKAANSKYESMKAEQNKLSKLFGEYKQKGLDTNELKDGIDKLKVQLPSLLEEARIADEKLQNLALVIPNFPDNEVPEGKDEDDNIELKRF